MQITKSFKYSPAEWDYGSKGYEITVSHSELGLPDPHSEQEAREVEAALSLYAERHCLIEEVKCGLIPVSSLSEKLKPWLPPSQAPPSPTTSSTEQA